jgi:hypothetical protein|nr:hypothetical protein [Clostridioides sp.]
MEQFLLILLLSNCILIAINKNLRNLLKLINYCIVIRKKLSKIKKHPNGDSDASDNY